MGYSRISRGPSGLLHRTPDEAFEKLSILMRLDHESFWDSMIDKNNHFPLTSRSYFEMNLMHQICSYHPVGGDINSFLK